MARMSPTGDKVWGRCNNNKQTRCTFLHCLWNYRASSSTSEMMSRPAEQRAGRSRHPDKRSKKIHKINLFTPLWENKTKPVTNHKGGLKGTSTSIDQRRANSNCFVLVDRLCLNSLQRIDPRTEIGFARVLFVID